MRIAHYRSPFPELARPFEQQNRIQKMINELFSPIEEAGWCPQVDVLETDTELMLRADLPGLGKDDVELDVVDGALILKGEKKEAREEKDAQYRVVERSYGAFERSFALPRSVDAEHITAEFRNGVLEVHLPKTEGAMGRRVEIAEK
jgi:HSP20 family protein